MVHRIAKPTFVSRGVGIFSHALTRNFSIQPATFVGAAIRKCDFANAFGLALDKAAFVAGPIWEMRNTIATDFTIDPITRILIPIGQCICACSMLQAVAKRTLVYAAISILFDHNIRSLRCQRPGHQCRSKKDRCQYTSRHGCLRFFLSLCAA